MSRSPSRQPRLQRVEETSAGGLVVDDSGARPVAAVIGRHDRRGRIAWSMPKGRIEAGESAEDAAVREVCEETGISGLVVGELGAVSYWFIADGRRVHKTVRHYLMRARGGELSCADLEVDAVAWVPLDELPGLLAYPDEQVLAGRAARLLADSA